MSTPEWLKMLADRIQDSSELVLFNQQHPRHTAGWQHKLSVERRTILAAILREAANG
jgi:hypothetical protein